MTDAKILSVEAGDFEWRTTPDGYSGLHLTAKGAARVRELRLTPRQYRTARMLAKCDAADHMKGEPW